jgi:hypothetical protein
MQIDENDIISTFSSEGETKEKERETLTIPFCSHDHSHASLKTPFFISFFLSRALSLSDIQGGIDVTITDTKQPPSTLVWGKLKRIFSNVGGGSVITVRGEMDANTRDVVDLDIQASGFGSGIKVTGSAGMYLSWYTHVYVCACVYCLGSTSHWINVDDDNGLVTRPFVPF